MSRMIVILAAIAADPIQVLRRIVNLPILRGNPAVARHAPADDQIWRDAERETVAFRIHSSAGLI